MITFWCFVATASIALTHILLPTPLPIAPLPKNTNSKPNYKETQKYKGRVLNEKNCGIIPFLSDPGVPGVRSLGPDVRPSVTDVLLT